jgi:uncharacterized protein YjbI with pentapeptide repeats
MKTKRKNIKPRKQDKSKVRKSVLTKRNNKKRNYSTKKRRMRFKGGMVEEEEVCPICLLPFQPNDVTITTRCGHKFHREELLTWCRRFARGECTCPLDRQNISADVAPFLNVQARPTSNPNNNIIETRTIEVNGRTYELGPGVNLPRANLSGADLSYINLNDADLSHADFRGADLSGANLVRANLRQAHLGMLETEERRRTYLVGADLREANLSNANLTGANLSGANLSGANLSNADLTDANLYGANLLDTDFRGAILTGTNLNNVRANPMQ